MHYTKKKFLKNKWPIKKIIKFIVGLGYVGMPLLIQLSKHFSCIGYDINQKRINYLSKIEEFNLFQILKI